MHNTLLKNLQHQILEIVKYIYFVSKKMKNDFKEKTQFLMKKYDF